MKKILNFLCAFLLVANIAFAQSGILIPRATPFTGGLLTEDIEFSPCGAVSGSSYSIGCKSGAPNSLFFNAPSSGAMEWSFNGAQFMSLADNATGAFMNINMNTTTGQGISAIADQLTTGSGFNLASNSANASSRILANFSNNNAAATGATVFSVFQQSTGQGATINRGPVASTNSLVNLSDQGTSSGQTLSINKSGGSYGNQQGFVNLFRNGNFTGVSGETASDLNLSMNYTLTEPGAGMFNYYAQKIDLFQLQVTNAAGGSTVAALYLNGSTDADINSSYSLRTSNGILGFGDKVQFETGRTMNNNQYQIGRDNDATNQLHFNVPTGATFEFSVNDVAEYVFSSTAANFNGNNINNAGDISGNNYFARAASTFSFEGTTDDAFETVVTVVDPSADQTITLPNSTGTVHTSGAYNVQKVQVESAYTLATATLTPNANVIQLFCNRAAGADTAVTLSEAGAVVGQKITVFVDGNSSTSGTCSFADTAGVQRTGAIMLDDYDNAQFMYTGAEWVQVSFQDL